METDRGRSEKLSLTQEGDGRGTPPPPHPPSQSPAPDADGIALHVGPSSHSFGFLAELQHLFDVELDIHH